MLAHPFFDPFELSKILRPNPLLIQLLQVLSFLRLRDVPLPLRCKEPTELRVQPVLLQDFPLLPVQPHTATIPTTIQRKPGTNSHTKFA